MEHTLGSDGAKFPKLESLLNLDYFQLPVNPGATSKLKCTRRVHVGNPCRSRVVRCPQDICAQFEAAAVGRRVSNVCMIRSMRGVFLRGPVIALYLAGCTSSSPTKRPLEVGSGGQPAKVTSARSHE